jgi:hypothetical protein
MNKEPKLSDKFKQMSDDEKLNEIRRFMNEQVNKISQLMADEIESVLKGLSKQFNIISICEYQHGVTTEYKYIIVEIKRSLLQKIIAWIKK